jgi:hypothetical protein
MVIILSKSNKKKTSKHVGERLSRHHQQVQYCWSRCSALSDRQYTKLTTSRRLTARLPSIHPPGSVFIVTTRQNIFATCSFLARTARHRLTNHPAGNDETDHRGIIWRASTRSLMPAWHLPQILSNLATSKKLNHYHCDKKKKMLVIDWNKTIEAG